MSGKKDQLPRESNAALQELRRLSIEYGPTAELEAYEDERRGTEGIPSNPLPLLHEVAEACIPEARDTR